MFPPFYFISASSFYVNFSFKNILISLVCHECLSITWIKYCRTASSKVLIKADKSPRSKHKLLFLFTKNDKGVFPTGVILRLLAPGSCLGSGSWLPWVLLLLVSQGGGEGAVGHQVAVALAPANPHVRGVTSHLNKCTDLWQALVDLRPPLNPAGPLLLAPPRPLPPP